MYLIIVYKTRAKLRKKERNTKQTVRFLLEKKRRIDSDIKKYVKQALNASSYIQCEGHSTQYNRVARLKRDAPLSIQ